MLRGISPILSPELLKVMREMGHGDEIILADANFPAAANAKRLIRLDGVEATDLLKAMLELMPLDIFVKKPVFLMKPLPEDPIPPIWAEYAKILNEKDFAGAYSGFLEIERFSFYDVAKRAFAIVQTGTTAHYANIGLKKGVL